MIVKMSMSVYIPRIHIEPCFAAIRNLSIQSDYAYVSKRDVLISLNIEEILRAWRYTSWETIDRGQYIASFIGVGHEKGPLGDDETLFHTIAPFSKGNISVVEVTHTGRWNPPLWSYYMNYGSCSKLWSPSYERDCLEKL